MIQYRHYKPLGRSKHYGIVLDANRTQPTLDIYFGVHVLVWFWSRH